MKPSPSCHLFHIVGFCRVDNNQSSVKTPQLCLSFTWLLIFMQIGFPMWVESCMLFKS